MLFVFVTGCLNTERHAGNFVQNTEFHLLQSYRVGEINLTGMRWIEQSSGDILEYTAYRLDHEIEGRGFTFSENNADFIVRAEWNKALRVSLKAVSPFGNVPELHGHDEKDTRPRVMCSLTIELYDPKKDQIFWRAHMPNCVDVLELREDVIFKAIEYSLRAFPARIELDRSLPNIQ